MNRKRLYKSSDAVIGGVCGGIAEYFGTDPTLVRIIAVALLVIGFGLPAILYVICMMVIPPDPGTAQGYVDTRAEASKTCGGRRYSGVSAYSNGSANYAASSSDSSSSCSPPSSSNPSSSVVQPPPPDPSTRVGSPSSAASERTSPSSGNAVATDGSQAANAGHEASSSSDASTKYEGKNHTSAVLVLGALLIGVGVLALLCNFVHVSVWRFWPVVLVVVGVVCLFTPGYRGWSLERAGNAIVLITLGLALLAWMLQIVQARVFIAAFMDLWPMLLVVIGLAVIGSARKSNIFNLASALVFSATIILSLWVYGGLDWASLGATSLFTDSDGVHEFLSDVPFRN